MASRTEALIAALDFFRDQTLAVADGLAADVMKLVSQHSAARLEYDAFRAVRVCVWVWVWVWVWVCLRVVGIVLAPPVVS